MTVFVGLILTQVGLPLLVAEAAGDEAEPAPLPNMSEPLAWYLSPNGTVTATASGNQTYSLASGGVATWKFEPTALEVSFPPVAWNVSFGVSRSFVGVIATRLLVEGSGVREVSLVATFNETACPALTCRGIIPVAESFAVMPGERIVVELRYTTPYLELTEPAPAAPAPVVPAAKTNRGTIKLHDDSGATPPPKNEPHVACEFYVEGFDMAGLTGALTYEWWPPKGTKRLVMPRGDTLRWTSDVQGSSQHHFVKGPYRLPAGHYRLEAYADAAHPGKAAQFAKTKTFWVDPCTAPAPLQIRLGAERTNLVAPHSIPSLPTPELGSVLLVAAGSLAVAGWAWHGKRIGTRRLHGRG